MSDATVRFPAKLQVLFEPRRYKVLYGGRGGAKSWSIAKALLIIGAQRPIKVLCCREIQKSIKESSHALLALKIREMGLEDAYRVLDTEIRGTNGTEFIFAGLRHNVDSIRSIENIDFAWVAEAAKVSKASWDVLIPTVRKGGSEIWLDFNPELDTDETYKRFVLNPPADAAVIPISWRDNPWFPEVLRLEMESLKQRDSDSWLHVYEGKTKKTVEGAIYASELRQAEAEGRITRVPYIAGSPVSTFWDLGHADATSIWFVQRAGFEWHVIDFLQDRLKGLDFYVQAAQSRGFVYHQHVLPHDADNATLATGAAKTVAGQLRARGMPVRVLPRLPVTDGISLTRSLFSRLWFDEAKCADGLSALRRYRYDVDADTGAFSSKPLHDENSHAADALRYVAMGVTEAKGAAKSTHKPRMTVSSGFMGNR